MSFTYAEKSDEMSFTVTADSLPNTLLYDKINLPYQQFGSKHAPIMTMIHSVIHPFYTNCFFTKTILVL